MIIKCPECGQEVSDRAPVCPHCGAQIEGHIVRCPHCGQVYFSDQAECPACHRPTQTGAAGSKPTPPPVPASQHPATVPPAANGGDEAEGKEQNKGCGTRTILLVSLLIAIIICGSMYYFYHQAQSDKEEEEYENAMSSSDPQVLQQYLDDYSGVDQAHTDSIEAHLQLLRQGDQDYLNAINSNSKSALEGYLETHPNTTHRGEIMAKIDSIDWAAAVRVNTPEAYQQYLTDHEDGDHADEARDKVEQLDATTVSTEDKMMAQKSLRTFFQAINSKNEARLTNSVTDVLDIFLGKTDATSEDVVDFMHKIYKADVKNMNFHLGAISNIKKQAAADGSSQLVVDIPADQVVETAQGKSSTRLRIQAVIEENGKISSMSMKKIVEG